jgi:hypothetical protein
MRAALAFVVWMVVGLTNAIALQPEHEIWGKIAAVNGNIIALEARSGIVMVDAAGAANAMVPVYPGEAVRVVGTYEGVVLHATTIQHAKDSNALWPPDR